MSALTPHQLPYVGQAQAHPCLTTQRASNWCGAKGIYLPPASSLAIMIYRKSTKSEMVRQAHHPEQSRRTRANLENVNFQNNYKVIRMIYEIFENEIVMLLLGVGVLIFILGNRARLKRLAASKILIAGFYVLLAGWVLTVLEGFFWEGPLNYLEHLCYAVSAVFVAVWCCKVFGGRRVSRHKASPSGQTRNNAFEGPGKEAL